MANKTIPALPIYGSQDSDKRKKDLIEITKNDGTYATPTYGTGASRKMSVEELKTALDITSQTVTDGITDKSPSENAVFDAVYAKGLINGTIWVNAYTALGDFNLSIDKYNNVGYTDAEGAISVILPTFNSTMSGKTIIVEPHRFNDGLTTVNISIPGLQKDGGGGAGTYTEVITKMGQIVTIQANYYGWHVIGHTNQVTDLSTYALLTSSITNGDTTHSPDGNAVFDALALKLDLSGGNANQDIDIGNFSFNAKHVKINGTGGAGHIGLKHQSANISASASESSIGADSVGDPVWKNDGGPIDKLELQSKKDSTGGYVGLTLLKINFKNVLNTFTSFFTNSNTASRTYTFQNRDGIIADDTDLAIANNQVAVETWSTNANYTTLNTTAKRLIILQTGTLTLPRTITLTNPSLSGQEVVIVASGSVTSTNYIRVACSFKINVTLNTFDIVSPYTQTFLTATNNTGNWTTGQASPQFVETVTALTASKTIRGDAISGGSSSSYTAPFTSPVRGDLKWNTNGGLMAYDGSLNEILAPYDPINGWMDYRPSGRNIKYWNQLDISSGNKPIEYSTNFGLAYYWGQTYKIILRGEGTDEYCEYTVYVDLSGVPSIQKTHKSSATLTMAIVSGGLRVTGPNCYAYIYKQGRLTALENPDLNQSFSNDGLINYWSGSLGVGHSSQNASAIGQFDSTTKGFLPPRMTNAQRTAIASPAIGLMVYCTDTVEGLYVYKSTGWTFIA